MSVESLAIAINHSKATGTARLVLIGIANHDGDGGAWPSLDTLARYAAVDRSNVRKALQKLEGLGEIRRLIQAGGLPETADHRRPNRYLFLLACPANCDRSSKHRTPHHAGAVQLDILGELSTRGAVAPPVQLSTGGAVAPRGRGAVAPPEPSPEPPTEISEAHTDRACAHSTWRKTNAGLYCAACGLRDDGRKRIDWATFRVTLERRRA